jgi:hypothetical protein
VGIPPRHASGGELLTHLLRQARISSLIEREYMEVCLRPHCMPPPQR